MTDWNLKQYKILTMNNMTSKNDYSRFIGTERIRRCHVTAKDISRFAQAIGENNRIYYDEIYALSQGYKSIVAPPLFCQTLTYDDVSIEQLPDDGSPVELNIDIPAKKTVGGSSQYRINRLLYAGETVNVKSTITNIYTKNGKSGLLYFIEIETVFESPEENEIIAAETATYIKRS